MRTGPVQGSPLNNQAQDEPGENWLFPSWELRLKLFIALMPFAICCACPVILLMHTTSSRVYQEQINFIDHLQSADIREIRIGDECLISPGQYQEFAGAFKTYQNFEPNRDLVAHTGSLKITTMNGQAHTYELDRYPRGIVVTLSCSFLCGKAHSGTIISPPLEQVLSSVANQCSLLDR